MGETVLENTTCFVAQSTNAEACYVLLELACVAGLMMCVFDLIYIIFELLTFDIPIKKLSFSQRHLLILVIKNVEPSLIDAIISSLKETEELVEHCESWQNKYPF